MLRVRRWTLDDAALTGGAYIAAAGGGLPRRIVPPQPADVADAYQTLVANHGAQHLWRCSIANSGMNDSLGTKHLQSMSTMVRAPGGPKYPHGYAFEQPVGGNRTPGYSATGTDATIDLGSGATPYTWEAWIRNGTAAALGFAEFWTRWAGGTGVGAWILRFWTTNTYSVPPDVMELLVMGGQVWFTCPYATMGDGAWHHAVLTYNGGGRGDVSSWQGYLDGVPKTTWFGVAPSGDQSVDTTAPLCIGGRYADIIDSTFRGQMDEMATYRGVCLTAQQVLDHYNAPIVGVSFATWSVQPEGVGGGSLDSVLLPGRLTTSADAWRVKARTVAVPAGQLLEPNVSPIAPSMALAAGETVAVEVDMNMPTGSYVAGQAGEGPALVYDDGAGAVTSSLATDVVAAEIVEGLVEGEITEDAVVAEIEEG